MILSGAFTLLLAGTLSLAQTYTVTNSCPTAIELFIGGTSQGNLATGATVVKTGLGPNAGFFYTTTNGGLINGQLVASRVGFFLGAPYWYYYIVRDDNPNNFNTGISVSPNNYSPANGFCTAAVCNAGNCNTAYTSPPVFHSPIPPPADGPPGNPPVYQCKHDDTNYSINFCPTGSFPTPPGVPLRHGFGTNKCVDVQGAVFANGTPVQIYDCNGTNAQQLIIRSGTGQIRVAGTNFCLDAGSSPANGVKMKIWQCYDNLAAQQWTYSNINRVTLANTGLCLDLTDGNTANGNILQTWSCTDFNNNQVWSHQF
ncbi:G-X-X-X-Q-X-W domain-containing protein [Coprinopsis sp. MPI-PUGE-AT-0042]|nr:G-X-X-X-Q-X-W domain-containing protein [Coprinopsis sp. MPI-PUGE-AT-0042]